MTGRAKRQPRVVPQPAPSKQSLRLWLRLLRTTRTIEADLRERLRLAFNTTLPRFDVMAALDRHAPGAGMSMTALSRHLLVSNGNATVIVDRLVDDGLVVRTTPEADRRSTLVRLTPSGLAQFRIMADTHEDWVAEIFAGVAPGEAQSLMQLLDRVAQSSESSGDAL